MRTMVLGIAAFEKLRSLAAIEPGAAATIESDASSIDLVELDAMPPGTVHRDNLAGEVGTHTVHSIPNDVG
jgi:hypothetical protein